MIVIKYIWYYSFWVWVRLGLRIYFSKVKISGKENIPAHMPIIFGSNHENAFLDALVMTTSNTCFDHYLVRADVFNNPIAKYFFNSLNLMPVYRIRDGVSSVKENDRIFEACYQALARKYSIMLFPEANHDMRRIERVIKKGIARIAYGAVNYEGGAEEICIVPVGVNYSDHTSFRSAVHVVYGKPIYVKRDAEVTNAKIEQLRAQINRAMSQCHVALDRDNFEALDTIFFHDQGRRELIVPEWINAKAKEIQIQPEEAADLLKSRRQLSELGLRFPYRPAGKIGWICAMLLAPLALIGGLLNAPVFLLLRWFISSKIKDPAFVASMKFGLGMVGLLAWWGFLSSSLLDATQNGLWVALFWIGAWVSLISYGTFIEWWQRIHMDRRVRSNSQLQRAYDEFVKKINHWR